MRYRPWPGLSASETRGKAQWGTTHPDFASLNPGYDPAGAAGYPPQNTGCLSSSDSGVTAVPPDVIASAFAIQPPPIAL